jgi:hypothetical protein
MEKDDKDATESALCAQSGVLAYMNGYITA